MNLIDLISRLKNEVNAVGVFGGTLNATEVVLFFVNEV